jgi:ATP-dependent RNA helicase SUPV3L1/SUV3
VGDRAPEAAGGDGAAEAVAAEPEIIEIWRPRRPGNRGQRRDGRERQDGRGQRRERDGASGKPRPSGRKKAEPGKSKDSKSGDGGGQRRRRDDRPAPSRVEDSPFAALMDLKKSLEKGGDKPT